MPTRSVVWSVAISANISPEYGLFYVDINHFTYLLTSAIVKSVWRIIIAINQWTICLVCRYILVLLLHLVFLYQTWEAAVSRVGSHTTEVCAVLGNGDTALCYFRVHFSTSWRSASNSYLLYVLERICRHGSDGSCVRTSNILHTNHPCNQYGRLASR